MSQLVLYELDGCPFCAKVRNKLAELGLEYDSRTVPRARSERTEVKEISGQTGVPVLVDEEHGVEGMPESDDIVSYLEETYGSGVENAA
ncbi:glutathione S-transferase N-terminal domain-containing protein [Halegenticoccus tardaugens]|uniref:glutathione S-transferase N-terminal domain-containing protein n=1 Tax=Halegenticoccus tardaugens TaxID=2071624 RepID=UPI00100A36AE|nr:glutathione S-transferase N-terminal domain-containing protein [Halegenticoccus tardaugens]